MKTKLELAHDWAMKHGDPENFTLTVAEAWDYADAMYEQRKERESKGVPEAILKASKSNGLKLELITHDIDCYFDNANNTKRDADNLIQSVYEQITGEVKTYDVGDWQPDWSQAPDGFNRFVVASGGGYGFFTNIEPQLMGGYYFVGSKGMLFEDHGYIGDWKNSLRKRPEGE